MNKDEDKWIKNLRNKMEDYSEPLPEGLWEQLEDDLAQPKVIPFWRRWTQVAAAAVLVLAVSSVVLWKFKVPADGLSDGQKLQLAEQGMGKQLPQAVEVVSVVADENAELLADNQAEKSFVQRVERRMRKAAGEVLAATMTESYEAMAAAEAEENVAVVDLSEEESANAPATQSDEAQQKKNRLEADRTIWRRNASYLAESRKKKASERKLQLGLLSGGMPYTSDKEFSGMSRFTSRYAAVSQTNQLESSANNLTAYNKVLFNNQHDRAKTKVKHRLPISVAASLKWYFHKDWALETGLSYTFLQSELHSGSNLYLEDTQKLHYLGIPLKIHRNIWNNSILSLYASAGGMVEKCISGTLESTYVTDNEMHEKESVSLHVHPLQWSVAASVGAQVNFTRALSLFVEPGVAYYFDDNSKIETIRKEHPCNFDLRFGLRFDLSK